MYYIYRVFRLLNNCLIQFKFLLGTKMATKAADWMIAHICDAKDKNTLSNTPDTCVLLGLQRRQYRFTPVQLLKSVTDFK